MIGAEVGKRHDPFFRVLSSGRTSCEDRRDTCSLVRLNPTLFVRIATPTRDLTSLGRAIHDHTVPDISDFGGTGLDRSCHSVCTDTQSVERS